MIVYDVCTSLVRFVKQQFSNSIFCASVSTSLELHRGKVITIEDKYTHLT